MARLRIYTDENVDVRIAEGLRRRGIDARSAIEDEHTGVTDEAQLAHATFLEAALFTHDHHLVELATLWPVEGKEHAGVVFVEMHRFGLGECVRRLALLAEVVTADEMRNHVEFL